MYIEAVTVCLDYSDYLEQIIPFNIPHFDRWIIVTSPEDYKTQKVCSRYGVECVKTHIHKKGSVFNKGRMINYGLSHLSCENWVVHLDSDTVLPMNFKKFLMNSELSTKNIYGMDRVLCKGRSQWEEYKKNVDPGYWWNYLVTPPKGWPIGGRVVHGDYSGFIPIGFFQMWHADSKITRYPVHQQANAEHTDCLHAIQWDRPNRVLIPEMYAIHLETEHDSRNQGANWRGRKTPLFAEGPPQPYELSASYTPVVTQGAPGYGGYNKI